MTEPGLFPLYNEKETVQKKRKCKDRMNKYRGNVRYWGQVYRET